MSQDRINDFVATPTYPTDVPNGRRNAKADRRGLPQ